MVNRPEIRVNCPLIDINDKIGTNISGSDSDVRPHLNCLEEFVMVRL